MPILNKKQVAIWRGGKIVGYQVPKATKARNQFEAVQPSQYRKRRIDRSSGDATMLRAGAALTAYARYLDENHDIATGILDILVNRTVGRGIRYEPQVMDKKGNLHDSFNEELLDRHTRWSEKPTADGEFTRQQMERLAVRTLFRDGEMFKVYHLGNKQKLQHNTNTPLSLEPLEPDFCPRHYNVTDKNINQGVEKNAWGKPRNYFFTKYHPGDSKGLSSGVDNYKTVAAQYVNHIKFVKRFHQTRGQTVFHSVLTRLDDIKDLEEAERIAARMSAKMVGQIKRGQADMYDDDESEDPSRQVFEDGMILFDGGMGTEFDLFDTKRPNNALTEFRGTQMRAVSSGVMVSNSSASKDYGGTFSSQRQELVEQQESYEALQDFIIADSCKPDYKQFVIAEQLNGIKIPNNVDRRTLYDVGCYGATMPWIDPRKEADANHRLLEDNLISESELIRRRGKDPEVVFRQIERDLQRKIKIAALKKELAELSND